MTVHKTLTLALAALTLSTSIATSQVAPALPDPNRCHDETTMQIGTLVDGECRSPAPPRRQGGYDMSWGPYSISADGGADGATAAGAMRPAAR